MEASRKGTVDKLEIERDFTKVEVDKFLKEIDLSKVDVVYFFCNPTKPEMPRRISLQSKESSQKKEKSYWDPEKDKDSAFHEFLQDIKAQKEKVQKYYQANEEQFKDVHTLEGQRRIAEATGVHGGSVVITSRGSVKLIDLTKAFIALANGLNDGKFVEDATFVLSFKVFAKKWDHRDHRVKLDVHSSTPLTEILPNIRRVMETYRDLEFRLKSHVASDLNQLPDEVTSLDRHFEEQPSQWQKVSSFGKSISYVGDFSKDVVEKFLTKISPTELKDVDEIRLTLNPKEPDMPRGLRIVSSAPIPSWDPTWESLKCEDSIPLKFFDKKVEQEKVVQDYYNENKEQLKDVTSLESQEKIENATGVHGGLLLLHASNQRWRVKYNLAFTFLNLARAMNRGDFDVNAPFDLSLKMFEDVSGCCIKLHMQSREHVVPVLHIIQQVVEQQNALKNALQAKDCTYAFKLKPDVAFHLNKLSEIKEARKLFESPIKGTTDMIDTIIKLLS